MSPIVIRQAMESDFGALLSLFEEVAAERMWIAAEPGFDKAKYRAAWRRMVHGPAGAQFVACDGNAIIGTLNIYVTESGEHDVGILVKQTHRGRGIGTLLIQRALTWAKEAGVATLKLGVFPHNTAAIHLYQKMGFVETARLERKMERRSGERWDVIVMQRECTEP